MVSGAGRGMGRAMALAFAGAGADVVVVDRDEESNRQTAAQSRNSVALPCLSCDVSDCDAIEALYGRSIRSSVGSMLPATWPVRGCLPSLSR
ncbi:MAG: hypothetical protein CM1200mP2_55760 [Planctomycetaceae bacterium]|nr:MAG: hypothetical protein CM1200mP2_55760 [Planctomycetaceae bacterium]